jgi:hypothetical protein
MLGGTTAHPDDAAVPQLDLLRDILGKSLQFLPRHVLREIWTLDTRKGHAAMVVGATEDGSDHQAETVCPAVTWARAQPDTIGPAHTYPDHELTVAQSHRIMQQHKTCRAIECPRKAAALSCLVRAGKLVPPASSPRERAATRGLRFEPAPDQLPVSVGPDMQTLLDVLDALTDPRTLVIRPCENMRSERE